MGRRPLRSPAKVTLILYDIPSSCNDDTDLEDPDGHHDLHHAAQEAPVVGGGDLSHVGGAQDAHYACNKRVTGIKRIDQSKALTCADST